MRAINFLISKLISGVFSSIFVVEKEWPILADKWCCFNSAHKYILMGTTICSLCGRGLRAKGDSSEKNNYQESFVENFVKPKFVWYHIESCVDEDE